MEKKCWSCKTSKPLDAFWKDSQNPDGKQGRCILCAKEVYNKNREARTADGRKRARLSRDRLQEVAAERLSSGCISCGESNILVLEFDHRDRDSKEESIAVMMQKCRSMKRFVAELDKCDVMCCNCHRIKTSHENGSWRLKYVQAITNT